MEYLSWRDGCKLINLWAHDWIITDCVVGASQFYAYDLNIADYVCVYVLLLLGHLSHMEYLSWRDGCKLINLWAYDWIITDCVVGASQFYAYDLNIADYVCVRVVVVGASQLHGISGLATPMNGN